jgi:hydroxyethylthiazole kinase
MTSARIDHLRQTTPLVQCLTNTVVTQFTANVLLAAGASPAMVDTPEEAADFARAAAGVIVNLGTPTAAGYSAMREAVRGAGEARTPWVLDPVACGGAAARSAFAADIVRHRPAAVRGNPSEIRALDALVTGSRQESGGRGVDATDAVESALPAAHSLARSTGAVIAVSGPRDLVVSATDSGVRTTWVTSGDPMMQLVVGTGCSLGALTAAYLGAGETDPHAAVVAAHAHAGTAGILARRSASAPGSFAVAWLDALHTVTGADIDRLARVEETVVDDDR